MSPQHGSSRLSGPPRLRALALAAGLAFAFALAPSTRAAEPLSWKFNEGEVIRYTLVQKTETKMKVGGREGGSKVEQISDVRWNVKSVSPEGLAQMTQTIDRVRVKMDAQGQPPFEFDSATKEDPKDGGPVAAQLVPMFRALAGFECSLTMDARGKIDNVKIPKETLEALRNSPLGKATNLFSEDAMKNMISQSSLVLPAGAEATAPGKSWNDQSKVPIPNLGSVLTKKTYTVKGPAEENPKLVEINLTSEMSVEPRADSGIQLEISDQKNDGRFLFDPAAGRIAESHVIVNMTQLITAGEQHIEQTVNNTLDMSLAADEPAGLKPSEVNKSK